LVVSAHTTLSELDIEEEGINVKLYSQPDQSCILPGSKAVVSEEILRNNDSKSDEEFSIEEYDSE